MPLYYLWAYCLIMRPTLNDIKQQVDKLAQKIQAPHFMLPDYGYSRQNAQPHIEIDDNNGQLYFVVQERGEEFRRDFAHDMDDLLYRIFEHVTFEMASRFELNNRIENEDCRRQLFSKQEELLGILNTGWKERNQHDHRFTLRSYPFNDNL